MSIQQRYNGVFEDITISDKKREEIEATMRNSINVKNKFKIKKYCIIAISLVMVLSMGIIVNAASDGELLNKLVYIAKLTINGNDVDKNNYDKYIDEQGEIKENVYEEELKDGGLIVQKYDEDGNVIGYEMFSFPPISRHAWHYFIDEKEILLSIPDDATLLEEREIFEVDQFNCIDITYLKDEKIETIPFMYEDKEYTVALEKQEGFDVSVNIYEGNLEYEELDENLRVKYKNEYYQEN